MVVKKRTWRWRIVRALGFGMVATLAVSYWAATVQDFFAYLPESTHELDIDPSQAPQYLGDLAPPFDSAWQRTPFGKSTDSLFYSLLPDFGTDNIEYNFTIPDAPSDWDPTIHGDNPPWVLITRYRLGWPMRAMYWDTLGIAPGGGRDHVNAYFAKALPQIGLRHGFETPQWWPISRQNYRMPITPIWSGFAINIALFAMLWLIPGVIWRAIRVYRRTREGLCLGCGYAIEDFDVCPECGSEHPGATTRREAAQ